MFHFSARCKRQKGKTEKQPPRSVPRKRCSENMQQSYRRTPMPKCNFNKVAKQLYWNHTSAWVFSCNFATYFQNTFPWEHFWVTASLLYQHILSDIMDENWIWKQLCVTMIVIKFRPFGRNKEGNHKASAMQAHIT